MWGGGGGGRDEGGGGRNADGWADAGLEIEVVGIDSRGRESGEDSAGSAADRRRQYAFEPKFKSFHELDHRYKGLFVERGDGVVQNVKGPVFVVALFPALAAVQFRAAFGSRRIPRPLNCAGDVLR